MIIAIADVAGNARKSILAARLSLMQKQAGRQVVLVDNDPQHLSLTLEKNRIDRTQFPRVDVRAISGKGMQPELENLGCRFQDIVIDTESRDSMGTRAALDAADKAIIVMDGSQLDSVKCDQLISRLMAARVDNPVLRIVLVLDKTDKLVQGAMARIHHCLTALAPIKLCKLTLSSLALSDTELIPTPGASVCPADQDDLQLLWQEIFATPKSA
jgi:chromosome partitioning protein